MKNNLKVNVAVNIIRTLVLTILSFITFPWACRYLESSALGNYSWAVTFVGYFLILAKIGIPNLAIRECVKVKDNKELLSNKVQQFFLLQLITTVLSFGLMCIFVFSIPQIRESKALIFILSLNFLVGAFSFEWVFIALEKQFYMCVRSIAVLCITAILIIIFVTRPDDVYIYAFLTISVTILTTISNLIYVTKFVSFKKTLPYSYKEYIKPLSVLCLLSLTISLYNQTDTFILGFVDQSKKEVGTYSVGVKGIDIIIGIITALSTVFIPRANYTYQKEDKNEYNEVNKYSVNILMFIVLPAIATMMILAKPICALISGNYENDPTIGYISSPYVLMTLSFMMLTYSLSDMIYGQILLPMKKEKHYLIALVFGTILNVSLSLLFSLITFKNNPSVGVAIGTLITDILVVTYLIVISFKYSKEALFNKNNLKIVIATLLVVGLTFAIKNPMYQLGLLFNGGYPLAMVIELVFTVIVDGILYLGVLFILKEELTYSLFKKSQSNGQ